MPYVPVSGAPQENLPFEQAFVPAAVVASCCLASKVPLLFPALFEPSLVELLCLLGFPCYSLVIHSPSGRLRLQSMFRLLIQQSSRKCRLCLLKRGVINFPQRSLWRRLIPYPVERICTTWARSGVRYVPGVACQKITGRTGIGNASKIMAIDAPVITSEIKTILRQ